VFTTPDLTSVTLVSSVSTNVPEPSTWAMMLVGFAGLGLVRYRIRLSSYILLRRQ
jgi:PEP-CTERM motif